MKRFTLLGFRNFFSSQSLAFDSSGESSFKLDFSKESLNEKRHSNRSSSGGISSLILLLILFLFSNFLSAQIITVDGLTNDWSGNPAVKHVQDAFGNGVVDNQFTEGSKDFLFADQLAWVIGQTKAKNDIANGGFGLANEVKYVDINNITQTHNGPVLVFAGDRTSNNGDAQIGFWFYLNSTAPVEVNGQRYFAPPHVRGDLLVLADFTGGGRLGTVKVYRWIGGEPVTPGGSTVVPNTNGNLETTNIASIVAENNAGTPNVPTGWNFPSSTYATNEFYEGFVDLSLIGGNTNFTCSATVLLETRSSQSVTASLDDFIGGTLGEVPTVTVNSPAICVGGNAPITAIPSPAGTYTYAWTVPQGVSNPGNVASFSTSVAGTYSVIVTTQAGCPSSLGSGTVTVNPPPTITCPSPGGAGVVCGVDATDAQMAANTAFATWFDTFASMNPGFSTSVAYAYSPANAAPVSGTGAPLTPIIGVPGVGVTSVSVTWTITDANGCINSCSQTFELNYGCKIACETVVTDLTCGQADSGSIKVTASGGTLPYNFYLFAKGETDLTKYLAKFEGANTEPGTFTFSGLAAGEYFVISSDAATLIADGSVCIATVKDAPLPVCPITGTDGPVCPNSSNDYSGPSGTGYTYAWSITGNGTISGAIDGQTVSVTAGSSCNIEYILTLIVTNAEGCSSTCTKTVNVQDTEKPMLTVPADATFDCAAGDSGVATATDNCDRAPVVTYSDAGTLDNCGLGVITRTWTATDCAGNFATGIQTITVKDDEKPVIVQATGELDGKDLGCNPTVVPPTFTASDNCSGNLTDKIEVMDGGIVLTSGDSKCTLYSQTWIATVKDCSGNEALPVSITYTWKVDTENPVITAPADYIICNETLPATLTATWTDNCSEGGEVTATGVLSDSTTCTTTYAYVFTVTDDCGNTDTKTTYITRETDTYANCETAFGKLESGSFCFLDDPTIKNNRWGWTNNITEEGTYDMPLYAGAAGCDITNRVPVGSAKVIYSGGKVSVVYTINEGYVMNEAHVNVSCGKYRMIKGDPTVAPGRYTFNASNLDKVAGLTVNFTGTISGPIWIIVHAVICEETCHCSQLTHGNPVYDNVALTLDCPVPAPVVETTVDPSLMEVSKVSETSKVGFEAYPVPFKNVLTIKYKFDYSSDVKIEVFNSNGILMLSKVDSNGYLNKETTLTLNSNIEQEQVYVVKVTTNRGSSVKKVMSSK